MSETSSRLLELLSLLQARRDWPGPELAERLEVSRRTIRRDIERLRALGYPVESLSGPAGGYRLRAGAAMPPLLLDEDEAIAIAVGLRTAARASVAGIEETSPSAPSSSSSSCLPAHLRRRVSALGSATIAPPVTGPTVDPQHLTVIASACRESECLRFAYRSRDASETRREVEPHSLVNLGRRWYLVAGIDPPRRLADVPRRPPQPSGGDWSEVHGAQAAAKDASAYVERSTAAPSRFKARVTVHASAAEITSRLPPYWGTFEPIDAQSCEYRAGDDDLGWLRCGSRCSASSTSRCTSRRS